MSLRCWEHGLPLIALLPTHLGTALPPDESQLVGLFQPGAPCWASANCCLGRFAACWVSVLYCSVLCNSCAAACLILPLSSSASNADRTLLPARHSRIAAASLGPPRFFFCTCVTLALLSPARPSSLVLPLLLYGCWISLAASQLLCAAIRWLIARPFGLGR